MIWTNWNYKGIDFTDSVQYISKVDNWYAIFLQNEEHNTQSTMNSFERANYHGGYSSEVLVNPRYLNFTWKIVWHTKALRHEAWNTLISAIQPDPNPASPSFYNLTFKDDGWNDRLIYAKVETMPQASNWLDDPIIEFSFTLYSETEKVYGSTTNTATWWVGIIWWNTFATTFPTTFSWYGWTIACTNAGNRSAPIKVSVVWNIVNPKIINTTNWQKYRIDKTTSNLIFNNRNEDNDPKKRLVVTDSWVDIRWYRNSWAGIYLNPWINNLVVIWDSYDAGTTVTITFLDTYIY